MNILQMKQRRAGILESAKALFADDMTPENRSIVESKVAEADLLSKDIASLEAIEAEEKRHITDFSPAPKGNWTNEEYRNFVETGEVRAMDTTTAGSASEAVIPHLDSSIMEMVGESSGLYGLGNGGSIDTNKYQKLITVSQAEVKDGQEGIVYDESGVPVFAQVDLVLKKEYAYPQLTEEMIDFSSLDVEGWLQDSLGTEFGNKTAKTLGDLVNACPTDATGSEFGTCRAVETETAGTVVASDLSAVLFALKTAYRKNSHWVMSSDSLKNLIDLRDAQDAPIFVDALVTGTVPQILGQPVVIDDSVTDIVLAQWNKFLYHRTHNSGHVMRRDDITSPGFIKIPTRRYFGAALMDSRAAVYLKVKTA